MFENRIVGCKKIVLIKNNAKFYICFIELVQQQNEI